MFDFLRRRSGSEPTNVQKKPPALSETPDEQRAKIRCSFCGKDQYQVRKIIAGPAVNICDECIDLCNDIIYEEVDREQQQQEQEDEALCTCCTKLHKRAVLSRFPDDTLFCESCMDGLWSFIRQSLSKKPQSQREAEHAACTICRQPYPAAELYEPTEEPLYCEFCLDELKRLAEERRNQQK